MVDVTCACGTVHPCSPSDSDPTGRKCFRCFAASQPEHCTCGRADCPDCGPRRIPVARRQAWKYAGGRR